MLSRIPYCFSVLFLGLLLSGCMRIELPPIHITLPFTQNTSFGEAFVGLPPGAPFDRVEIPLGSGACEFVSLDELFAALQAAGGSLVANFIGMDTVLVRGITLRASSGDFDFLEEIAFTITASGPAGEQEVSLAAQNTGGLGTEFTLEAETPFSLWEVLSEDMDCLSGSVTFQGTTPAQPVVFDTLLELVIFP